LPDFYVTARATAEFIHSGLDHRLAQMKRPPCGGPFQWLPDDQAAATAALFLIFLRRAKNPSRPAPPANSGSVAGMGVAPVDWP